MRGLGTGGEVLVSGKTRGGPVAVWARALSRVCKLECFEAIMGGSVG